MAFYSHPFKIGLLEVHKFSRWLLTSAEENRIIISRMWTQICRILKWIQIFIMFFNSAINPKSACLTTHFLRGPNRNQMIAWHVYMHYTWSGHWAISTVVISFRVFGLKVHQFAPGNEFSSPHLIYIYSQLSDFTGWLSSLAQANLTSFSSESDAVIFWGFSRGSHVGSEQTSPLHLLQALCGCLLPLKPSHLAQNRHPDWYLPEAPVLQTWATFISAWFSPRSPLCRGVHKECLWGNSCPLTFLQSPQIQIPNAGCKLQIEASLEFFAILVSNPHTKQKQCDHCANIALKP